VLTTRFTRLIDCNVPIQQAGMGAWPERSWRPRSLWPARGSSQGDSIPVALSIA
jgi:hypothetical protein